MRPIARVPVKDQHGRARRRLGAVTVGLAASRQEPLRRLRAHGERAREDALAKARQQLASGRDPHEVLGLLAHALTNRLLHAPTVALRDAALAGEADLARAAERMFPPLAPGQDTPGQGGPAHDPSTGTPDDPDAAP